MGKTWKDEYVNSMGTVKFSKRQKARIVQFLVTADSEGEGSMDMWGKNRIKNGMPIRRLAIAGICICVLAVGTVGANAAGILKPVSEVFGNVFHLNKNTSEIVDKMGNSLNALDSSAGVTVTADAAIGDDYNCAMIFSLENEDGKPFDSIMGEVSIDKWRFESESVEEEPTPSSWAGGVDYYFDDADTKDASVQFVYKITSSNKINGKGITAEFSNLGYEENGEFIKVLDGNWKLKFQLDFQDSSVELQAGQHLEVDNIDMIIKSVKVSPVGFHVEFEDPENKAVDELLESADEENAFGSIPIILTLSNGETINLTELYTSMRSMMEGLSYTHGGTFDKIIPIDKMESISIGGIDFKIA